MVGESIHTLFHQHKWIFLHGLVVFPRRVKAVGSFVHNFKALTSAGRPAQLWDWEKDQDKVLPCVHVSYFSVHRFGENFCPEGLGFGVFVEFTHGTCEESYVLHQWVCFQRVQSLHTGFGHLTAKAESNHAQSLTGEGITQGKAAGQQFSGHFGLFLCFIK